MYYYYQSDTKSKPLLELEENYKKLHDSICQLEALLQRKNYFDTKALQTLSQQIFNHYRTCAALLIKYENIEAKKLHQGTLAILTNLTKIENHYKSLLPKPKLHTKSKVFNAIANVLNKEKTIPCPLDNVRIKTAWKKIRDAQTLLENMLPQTPEISALTANVQLPRNIIE